MLGETLQDGTGSLDQRTDHDGPAATKALGEPRRDGDSKDRAKLVAGVDKAQQVRLDAIVALGILVSISEDYACQQRWWNRAGGS